MIIKFKEYTLRPGPFAKDRFDVLKTIPVTVKSDSLPSGKKRSDGRKIGDIYEKEDPIAYDLLLENAIEKIIRLSLAEKEIVTDLGGYLKEYKKAKLEIENLLK